MFEEKYVNTYLPISKTNKWLSDSTYRVGHKFLNHFTRLLWGYEITDEKSILSKKVFMIFKITWNLFIFNLASIGLHYSL